MILNQNGKAKMNFILSIMNLNLVMSQRSGRNRNCSNFE